MSCKSQILFQYLNNEYMSLISNFYQLSVESEALRRIIIGDSIFRCRRLKIIKTDMFDKMKRYMKEAKLDMIFW